MAETSVWCWVVALALLILVVVYVAITLRNEEAVAGNAPMPPGKTRILTLYLLTFGVFLVFMLVSLTSLDFPETPLIPLPAVSASLKPATPTPTPSPSPSPSPASSTSPTPTALPTQTPSLSQTPQPTPTPGPSPVLLRIFPQVKGDSTSTARLALYGKNFTPDTKVRFNSQDVPKELISDNLINAPVTSEFLQGRSSITVDLVNGDAISNAITVLIERPTAELNVFFCYRPWVTREIQLLLLVIFAGALGSYLHAIRSITDYIGGRQLISSWFWWYITRPFLGMAMGLVFYAVLRGGFLTGSPADAKVVNPFGVLAIGALVECFPQGSSKTGRNFCRCLPGTRRPLDALQGSVPLIFKLSRLPFRPAARSP